MSRKFHRYGKVKKTIDKYGFYIYNISRICRRHPPYWRRKAMKKIILSFAVLSLTVAPLLATEVIIGDQDGFYNDPWCGG